MTTPSRATAGAAQGLVLATGVVPSLRRHRVHAGTGQCRLPHVRARGTWGSNSDLGGGCGQGPRAQPDEGVPAQAAMPRRPEPGSQGRPPRAPSRLGRRGASPAPGLSHARLSQAPRLRSPASLPHRTGGGPRGTPGCHCWCMLGGIQTPTAQREPRAPCPWRGRTAPCSRSSEWVRVVARPPAPSPHPDVPGPRVPHGTRMSSAQVAPLGRQRHPVFSHGRHEARPRVTVKHLTR